MGAKIYHFEWINDFSAVKNYAIDQASGDWIAFLDADEYLSDKDVKKLVKVLGIIERDPKLCHLQTAIISPCIQLDDNGQPFFYATQQRFFRNAPEIRYTGQIHESLTINEQSIRVDEINVMHTGYSVTAYTGTGKAHRSVEMLTAALEKDPENLNLKCYLADSLVVRNDDGDIETTDRLYREAITGGDSVLGGLKQGANNHLIVKNYDDEKKALRFSSYAKKHMRTFLKTRIFATTMGVNFSRPALQHQPGKCS